MRLGRPPAEDVAAPRPGRRRETNHRAPKRSRGRKAGVGVGARLSGLRLPNRRRPSRVPSRSRKRQKENLDAVGGVAEVEAQRARRDQQLPISRSSRKSSVPRRSRDNSRERKTPLRPSPALSRKKKEPGGNGSGAVVAAAEEAVAPVGPVPRPRHRKADQGFESPAPAPDFKRMNRTEHSAKPSH